LIIHPVLSIEEHISIEIVIRQCAKVIDIGGVMNVEPIYA
jgi:hypothetical protein